MLSTIRSTASLQLDAPASSSDASENILLVALEDRRMRAGSIGRTLNAANDRFSAFTLPRDAIPGNLGNEERFIFRGNVWLRLENGPDTLRDVFGVWVGDGREVRSRLFRSE